MLVIFGIMTDRDIDLDLGYLVMSMKFDIIKNTSGSMAIIWERGVISDISCAKQGIPQSP
jgi:hypothetical protein